MRITKITDNKFKVEGDFKLSESGEPRQDLTELSELLLKNVDFKTQHGAFQGFVESGNKEILAKELQEAGTPYEEDQGALIIIVNANKDLDSALRAWADEAGAAGYFFLVIAAVEEDIESLAHEYLASKQRPSQALLVLEDISDGDQNLFMIESKNQLLTNE